MNTFLTTLIILLSTILVPTPKQVTVMGERTSRINGVKEVVDTTLQLPEEGYILETSGRKAVVKARSRQGLIYARATLAQLAGLEPSEMMNDDAFKKVQTYRNGEPKNSFLKDGKTNFYLTSGEGVFLLPY